MGPAQRPRRYQPPPRPHPADYNHDDAWTSDSGFHSARPPRRPEPYYYDYYDYGYDPRPPQKPSGPNSEERPPRPNSLSMDDMMKEAKEYSGKTRGLADMVDDLHGVTYGDKIVGEFLGDPNDEGINFKSVSGLIRNGADMMDKGASLLSKLSKFSSK